MDKQENLRHIRVAKRAHLNWVSHAHALILGMPLEENQIPVYATDCKFGQWYYHDGQVLASIKGFREIEQSHIDLHETYQEIFKLLFRREEKKQGFWGKLFGRKVEITDEQDKTRAQQLYTQLKAYSEVVVSHLDTLEKELNQMDDEKFNDYLRFAYKAV